MRPSMPHVAVRAGKVVVAVHESIISDASHQSLVPKCPQRPVQAADYFSCRRCSEANARSRAFRRSACARHVSIACAKPLPVRPLFANRRGFEKLQSRLASSRSFSGPRTSRPSAVPEASSPRLTTRARIVRPCRRFPVSVVLIRTAQQCAGPRSEIEPAGPRKGVGHGGAGRIQSGPNCLQDLRRAAHIKRGDRCPKKAPDTNRHGQGLPAIHPLRKVALFWNLMDPRLEPG